MVTGPDQRTRQEVHKPLYEVASSPIARHPFIGNIYKKDPDMIGASHRHKEGTTARTLFANIIKTPEQLFSFEFAVAEIGRRPVDKRNL